MGTSFFQSLITRQPCEEMSYKVQRPLPTTPGAPATAAGDALPGPASWDAHGAPWSLCPGSLGRIPLCWPCAGMPAGPSPPLTAGGPGISLGPGAEMEVPGTPLGSRTLLGFGVSPCQCSPSRRDAHLHPTASRLPAAAGGGSTPGVPQIRPVAGPRAASPSGSPPPLPCSERPVPGSAPWAAGAKAQMLPRRLPRRCHLCARGCQAGGGPPLPPGHPTSAPRHCKAGYLPPPKTVSPGLCGGLGEGVGTPWGGRKRGRHGRLPSPAGSRGHCHPLGAIAGGPYWPPLRPCTPPRAWGSCGAVRCLRRPYRNKGWRGWAEAGRAPPWRKGHPGTVWHRHPVSPWGSDCDPAGGVSPNPTLGGAGGGAAAAPQPPRGAGPYCRPAPGPSFGVLAWRAAARP